MMLTQDRLKKLVSYNCGTGEFTSLIQRGKSRAGSIIGSSRYDGYKSITINYRHYLAHRLAWFYICGRWPREHIDHINGDPSDNSFSNLREATNGQNNANSRMSIRNRSGVRGVRWHDLSSKWLAEITKNGKTRHPGIF